MKPRYIAYIIWIVIALLGVICWLVPEKGIIIGKWTLRWPTLTEVLYSNDSADDIAIDTTWLVENTNNWNDSIQSPSFSSLEVQPLQPKYHLFDSTSNLQTIDTITHISKKSTTDAQSKPITNPSKANDTTSVVSSNIDTRKYLTAFYQALDNADRMSIRVVHYGDSQIEEDRITDILRERWQRSFGGGGVGLLPLHQTVATRSIRQWISINGVKQHKKGGPKRHLIYGPNSMRKNDDDYGVMGQVAVMDNAFVEGSEDLIMHISPAGKKDAPHKFFSQIRLLTSNITGNIIANDTIIKCEASGVTTLPKQISHCKLHLQGKGNVYGVSLETPTGVIVDNVPMRGCSGTIFSRIDNTMLHEYFTQTNTRLIILQYGGNMIPYTNSKSSINAYVRNLRTQIRYIRSCAPEASILFVGPSDMATRIDGKLKTYPMVPYLDKQLRLLAEEEHIGYWSIYEAMGGYNSMVHWKEIGLAGSDYVHFTRSGANKIGKMLGEWIDAGKGLYN